jgi:hypothetical protein
MAEHQRHNCEREHLESIRQRISLKALLKEEEPQKIGKIIDKIERSRVKVDEYVSRITGIETKIITTTRNWHKIIKKVIIEDGKEVLESVLKELEQELLLANEIQRKNLDQGSKQEIREKKEPGTEVQFKQKEDKKVEGVKEVAKSITIEETIKDTELAFKLSKTEDSSRDNKNLDLLIAQELELCSRRALAKSKTAVEILLGSDTKPNQLSFQENKMNNTHIMESYQEEQVQDKGKEMETEDIPLYEKEEILMDIELLPSDFLLSNAEYQKNSKEKVFNESRDTLDELKGSSLEDSTWAPKESTCKEIGEYKAKIAAALLPGDTKEERLKFVKGTLYKSSHITKIEECFTKGNPWMVISLDCRKGVEILKEKLKKKEIEWYNVIFEDPQAKSGILAEEKPRESKINIGAEKATASSSKGKLIASTQRKQQDLGESVRSSKTEETKGKNRDFTWITLWDLPSDYSKNEIRRALKHLGVAEEITTYRQKFCQAAEAKISTKSEEQIRKIKANWVIGLENGKLARLTTGNINREDLREREGFRATLTNVPSSAQEALLLRALRSTEAKSVYIPYNSNRNPSRIAKVFFKSEEDMKKALNRSIYYFNTKLCWKEKVPSGEKENREQDFYSKQRESSITRGKRAASPWQPYRKREIIRPSEESLTRTTDISRNTYQQKGKNNMSIVLSKLLDRLEALENRWENSQRPQEIERPNRS